MRKSNKKEKREVKGGEERKREVERRGENRQGRYSRRYSRGKACLQWQHVTGSAIEGTKHIIQSREMTSGRLVATGKAVINLVTIHELSDESR